MVVVLSSHAVSTDLNHRHIMTGSVLLSSTAEGKCKKLPVSWVCPRPNRTADTRKPGGNAIVRRLACSVVWKLSFSVFMRVALPFPQFALLHSVTCVLLGNRGCVAVASFLGVPSAQEYWHLRCKRRGNQVYMLMPRRHSAGQNHNIKTANRSFEKGGTVQIP
jgi:hypothetical protein